MARMSRAPSNGSSTGKTEASELIGPVVLIDISGGTYFPGAKSASDGTGRGPYFLEFAKRARAVTTKPLMLTGGFKTRAQAEDAVASGAVDIVGLARGAGCSTTCSGCTSGTTTARRSET